MDHGYYPPDPPPLSSRTRSRRQSFYSSRPTRPTVTTQGASPPREDYYGAPSPSYPSHSPHSPSSYSPGSAGRLHPHWQSGNVTPGGAGLGGRYRSRANSGVSSGSDDSSGRRSRARNRTRGGERRGITEKPISRLPSPHSLEAQDWMVVRSMTDHSFRLEVRPRIKYTKEQLALTDPYLCVTEEGGKEVWHSACKRTDGFSPSTCDAGYHSISLEGDVAVEPISLTDNHPYAISILPWTHSDIDLEEELLLRDGDSVGAFIEDNAPSRAESLERYKVWLGRNAFRRSWSRLDEEARSIKELRSRVAELDGHCSRATKVVLAAHDKLAEHRLTLEQPATETHMHLTATKDNLSAASDYLTHLENVRDRVGALKGGSQSAKSTLHTLHDEAILATCNFRSLYEEVQFGLNAAERTNSAQTTAVIGVSVMSFDQLHDRLDGVKNAKVQMQAHLDELEKEMGQKRADQGVMTDTARQQEVENAALKSALSRAEEAISRADKERRRQSGGGSGLGSLATDFAKQVLR
ncbi:hypothetical protein IAR50_005806 [Cryptococcus sp. DSM 104548]